jgi:aminopeptidase YwaD
MRKTTVWILPFVLSLGFGAGLIAQTSAPLLSEKELRALVNEISGERAQEYIRYITHFQRLQPSRGYHASAEWVAAKAKEFGLSDVRIEEYPTGNGTKYYYMDKMEPAWDVQFAELWIVEPKEEKLTDFEEIPMSLAIMSRTCDVKGELVYVGEGTTDADYAQADVKKKIVYASGSIGTVASLAVDKFGALGVVTINQRYAEDEPDNVSSIRIRTKTPSFGFQLSHRRGEELRRRLQRGEKLTARAVVKTEVHDFPLENVVAVIPGSDLAGEEIILTAHLCHLKPGANDNASGSACLLEIGRSLKRLIGEGKIDRPRRTLRFIWVPENSGSIAYAATHPDIVSRMVAGLNFDMVGQYLNKNNSTFFLNLTPHSRPHYVNDVLINLTEFLAANNVQSLENNGFPYPVLSLSGSRDAFRYRITGYTGGSDQVLYNDGAIGVPMPFFLVWPDRYYHTSGDQPEFTDPTQLKRSSFLGAAAAVFLMDDTPEKSRGLAAEAFAGAQARIAREAKRSFDEIEKAVPEGLNEAHKEALNFIEQAYRREAASLATIKAYSRRDPLVDRYVDTLIQALASRKEGSRKDVSQFFRSVCEAKNVAPREIGLTAEEKAAMKVIPVRNPELKGPLGREYLAEQLQGQNVSLDLAINRAAGNTAYEVFNFMDGKNSLLDIRNAVSAEYEPFPLKWVEEFADVLARAGIIKK